MKKEVINCLTWYANKMSEILLYNTWSDEYCRRQIKESADKFYQALSKCIDFNNLTAEEAKSLRFKKWDDESGLYLFPLWLVPIIPKEMELTTIDGDKVIYDGSNVDLDIRFGCTAFGLEIKE